MALTRAFRTRAQFSNQLLDRRGKDPVRAITDLIGIYSTSPTSHLGLIARLDGYAPTALEKLVKDRLVVRMGAMRGSGYFVPVDLAPTIVAAIGTRREAVFNEIIGKLMDGKTYERLASKIEKIVAGRELTTSQIRKVVKEPRYDEHIRDVIRLMTTECRLVATRTSGTWRSNLIYLAPWSEWLPDVDPWSAEPEEAKRDLARLYFRAHGPATVKDFAWWSGFKKGAEEIVDAAGIEEVDDGCFGAAQEVKPARGVRLLWDLTVTKSHHVLKVAPFDRFSDQTKRGIERECERLAAALGAPDVEVRWVKRAGPLGPEWNRFMSPLRDQ